MIDRFGVASEKAEALEKEADEVIDEVSERAFKQGQDNANDAAFAARYK